MMGSMVARLVGTCTRHVLTVLILATLLTIGTATYSVRHFAMTTDTAELISPHQEWRQRELAFEKAFPSLQKLTIVVVDGTSPELAERAASRLASALAQKTQYFVDVRQAEGGPFFERHGLLYLPLASVQATTERLLHSEFVLDRLTRDPSLRGVLAALRTGLDGVRHGQGSISQLEPLMRALQATMDEALNGRPASFSLPSVTDGIEGKPQASRRALIVQPVLDYSALQPGAAASEQVKETAKALGLDASHGIAVHITGPVPLGDEEFASLAKDGHWVALAMLTALLGILWLAVRSARIELAILITTFAGLIVTTALGLLLTGRFNVVSVAFIPLFVGLGIDFSIQMSVRVLAERSIHADLRDALISAGRGVGRPLALAAASIGVGFFAFLPTNYIGVAELGVVAGVGMLVAFGLSVTLLPALLSVLRAPAAGMAEVGFPWLAPIEGVLARRRRTVLTVGFIVAALSAAVLPSIRFDFDPLNLKSPNVESMTTLRALRTDPNWTPNAINVIAPSLEATGPIAQKLSRLPPVSRAVTISSFIPTDQPQKLASIATSAARLAPLFSRPPASPPSISENLEAIADTISAIRNIEPNGATGTSSQTIHALAATLDRVMHSPESVQQTVASSVAEGTIAQLHQVKAMLEAGPVTFESLPKSLVQDWITKDGRARIQVFPQPGQEDEQALGRFSEAVQTVAPDATGVPISIRAAGDSIVTAFAQAGAYAALVIVGILIVALQKVRDVVLTMLPVVLSGLLTFASCAVFNLPLNFANIIALPLLFGIGVAFNIYFVVAWRAGETAPLQSSLMRAVIFSALTTATAFGALWLSSHPGTASMGRLLMISLVCEILVTLIFRPALLAIPPSSVRR